MGKVLEKLTENYDDVKQHVIVMQGQTVKDIQEKNVEKLLIQSERDYLLVNIVDRI